MQISLTWLRELIDLPENTPELRDSLTMIGLAVDAIETAPDGDTVLELDVTANRGDCLSHLGAARELAAIYDRQVRLPGFNVAESHTTIQEVFEIQIADPDLCGRYCGRYIEGIEVGPSPDWMVRRLEAVGIRPINNIADITNYVLMELGQPLHAFDADRLAGQTVVVRRAGSSESLKTLDGQERKLEDSTLIIADGGGPVALAGIMGGEATEISDSTRNVLVESAWFDPMSVRQTARRLNLSTEASYRFERGTDIEMARFACDRTAQLIQELAGGQVRSGVIDIFPGSQASVSLHLRRNRLLAHLGMEVGDAIVTRILTRLGFEIIPADDGWDVRTPSHRHDIAIEEDLLEEIARHYGYERFPSTLPASTGSGRRLPWYEAETTLRDLLSGLGYSETCSLVFSSSEIEETFSPDASPFVIQNPLSEKEPSLRTSLAPSMLRSLRWNLNRGIRDLQFYELGKVYPATGEHRRLVLAATGALRLPTPHAPGLDSSFYSLKGDVEALLERFEVETEPASNALPLYFHPGRSARLGKIAVIGELAPQSQESFKLRQKVYLAEIDVEALYQAGVRRVAVSAIPKYPAIRRDLSLLLNRQTRYGELVEAVEAAGIDELVLVEPFDQLNEGPFPSSSYSLAVGLVFQAPDRTLTDGEVQMYEDRILVELEKIGVKLRT